MKTEKVRVAVVGIGSAGFGCAYMLLKNGIRTALIEKNKVFGGTSVASGVNCWEPGVCNGELHKILADKLSQIPNACAVCKTIPGGLLFGDNDGDFHKYPWGLSIPDKEGKYEDTLKRCLSLTGGKDYRRFQFEPDCMSKIMQDMILEYSENATVFSESQYVSCVVKDRRIQSIDIKTKDGITRIYADYFVDCSGDIYLARDAGCKAEIGSEDDEKNINGVSYIFRIRKLFSKNAVNEEMEYKTVSCFNMYPNGDININMLPTVLGSEYSELGDRADDEGKNRVSEYFKWLKEKRGLDNYEIVHIFPQPGVREGHRLVGKYVLTKDDVVSGRSEYPCEIAAIADHAIDIHGTKPICTEIEKPYAIPMDCLIPNEIDNLLVACKGASFSHEAASSARLSRTMLTLGESAGKHLAHKIKNK